MGSTCFDKFPIPASCYSELRSSRMRMFFVRVSQLGQNGATDCAATNQFPFSEGARPQLVLPQRGADRQALPASTSDSAQDPGKPRHKPIAERLALFPKTAERKRHCFLCRRPARQTVLNRSPLGQHLQRLKWLAAARLPDQISSVGMSQLVCFVEGKQENGIAVQKRMEPTRGVPTVCGI